MPGMIDFLQQNQPHPIPPTQGPGFGGGGMGPQGMKPPKNFLPMSPEFEAGRRGVEDQLAATLSGITQQRSQIPLMVNMMTNRLNTDQTHATNVHNENMAERGIYNSSVNPYLQQRDIGVPFGRSRQDLANQASESLSGLAQQEGQAYLDYNNAIRELYLALASQQAENMPLSLDQTGARPKRKRKKGKK